MFRILTFDISVRYLNLNRMAVPISRLLNYTIDGQKEFRFHIVIYTYL